MYKERRGFLDLSSMGLDRPLLPVICWPTAPREELGLVRGLHHEDPSLVSATLASHSSLPQAPLCPLVRMALPVCAFPSSLSEDRDKQDKVTKKCSLLWWVRMKGEASHDPPPSGRQMWKVSWAERATAGARVQVKRSGCDTDKRCGSLTNGCLWIPDNVLHAPFQIALIANYRNQIYSCLMSHSPQSRCPSFSNICQDKKSNESLLET